MHLLSGKLAVSTHAETLRKSSSQCSLRKDEMPSSQVDLAARRCKPCEGGMPPMGEEEAEAMLQKVEGWELRRNKIRKAYRFRDFKESMRFVNRVAELAEEEGHHPDLSISWNRVTITLTTHAIGGLSENDFIMAAKIDRI
jgi:4a-hydroxytetrahydrobiopterin dehydratase